MNIFDLQATISLNGDSFMQGVQQAQGAFSGLGSSVSAGAVAIGTMVGNMATKAASGLIDLGTESVKTGMNFDAAMSNVKAISGATGEEFDSLRDKAKEMGASTKFTATEAAEAFSYMAMAGWDAESMLSGIEGIMNLAAASGESLATTSDIVTDALTAFGLSAEDSGHFADVLAAASSAANTNVSMMGETFKYVAPLAGTMGYSVEDMATAIGTMANSGIKGSQAGTALRSAITRLVKPTKEVTTAMEALGINGGVITDSDGNMLSFSETIDVLRGAFAGLDEATQAEFAAMLFGQEAMSGMLAIINSSTEEYDKLAGTISGASEAMGGIGAAAEMAQKQIDNLQGDVTIFQSAFDGLKTAIYDKFKEPLRDAVQTATDMMSTLSEAVNNGGISEAFATIGRSVAGFASAKFDELTAKLGTFGDKLQEVAGIAAEYGGQIGTAVGDAFGKIRDTVAGFDFGAAFAGIGEKIGGAIEQIRPQIEERFGMLRDVLADFGAGFAESFDTGVFETLGGAVEKFAGAFASFQGIKFEAITSGIRDFTSAFDGKDIGGAVAEIAGNVLELVGAFASASADTISGVAGAVKDFLSGFDGAGGTNVIAQVAKDAGDFFSAFIGASADTISAIGGGVKSFLDAFPMEDMGGVIAGIAKSAGDLFGAFKNVASTVVSEIAGAIKTFLATFDYSGAATIIEKVAEVIGTLFGHFSGAVAGVVNSIADAFAGFGSKIAELWNTVGPNLSLIGDAITSFADYVKAGLDTFMPVFEAVVNYFANVFVVGIQIAIDQVISVFGGLVNSVAGIFGSIMEFGNAMVSLFKGDLTGAVEHFKHMWEDIKAFFAGLASVLIEPFRSFARVLGDEANNGVKALKAPFEKIGEWFRDIGGRIVEGLKTGISNAWSSLTSWFSDKITSLTDGVLSLLGINSPSKVYAAIGSGMVEGLEVGWGREFTNLEAQVYDSLGGLVSGVGKIGFDKSALGKSSEAGISSMWAAYAGWRDGTPYEINLVLDGDVAAKALYDPLRRRTEQRGEGALNYA